ncbi:MAG: acyl-CoA desaturase [Myxococcales bacterium]|nr:acyl-CoA desaturase [Myxococcales bacterium]
MQRTLPKYPPHGALRNELKAAVQAYLDGAPHDSPGGWRIFRKSLVIGGIAVGSYLLLLLVATAWWQAIPLSVVLAFALAGIGFNIMHDGGHGSYASHRAGNRMAAMTLDILGGSSYVWRFKHNFLHHSYPNVAGVDDDLEAGALLRLSPHQPRMRIHRFQHWYAWLLYGALAVKWHVVDDYRDVITGRVAGHRMPRPRGWDLVQFLAGKLIFISWAFVIPIWIHGVWLTLAFYLLCFGMMGVIMAAVFQLAHCVEGADQFDCPESTERLEHDWAEQQLATTVNFARGSRLLTWYLGGLNYQVEHHLFPKISHVHYPAVAEVVREVCLRHHVAYREHVTLWDALTAHARHLRDMGHASAVAASAAAA